MRKSWWCSIIEQPTRALLWVMQKRNKYTEYPTLEAALAALELPVTHTLQARCRRIEQSRVMLLHQGPLPPYLVGRASKDEVAYPWTVCGRIKTTDIKDVVPIYLRMLA